MPVGSKLSMVRFLGVFLPGILLLSGLAIGFKLVTVVSFYRWQAERRALFIRLLGIDMKQQLDLVTVREVETVTLEDGLVRRLLVFTSSFDEEIPCYLFYYENLPKSPAILVASGHGSGIVETTGLEESYQHGNALYLAQQGFVTLTCENRGQGFLAYFQKLEEKDSFSRKKLLKRPFPGNENQKFELNEWDRLIAQQKLLQVPQEKLVKFFDSKSYMGLVLQDQRRALDYLESLDFVDASQVGAAGISMGGEIAFYLAAIDPRIKSVVVMGWLTPCSQLLDDIETWNIPEIDQHFPTMADIGALLPPRYSLFHNGFQEGRHVVGVGFPADLAKLLFKEIAQQYFSMFVPSRTEFHSQDVEHEFINSLAADFFKRTLLGKKGNWLLEDSRCFLKYYLRQGRSCRENTFLN